MVPKVKRKGFKRTIPVPILVADILDEAFDRQNQRPSDPIVPNHASADYRQNFCRYLKVWNKQRLADELEAVKIEPYGLRRSLLRESLLHGFHGTYLDIYRGRKPDSISAVDWKHYLDRFEFDPDANVKVLREKVSDPLDSILEPYRRKWNGQEKKVIPMAI
jgi:hypothetical protein